MRLKRHTLTLENEYVISHSSELIARGDTAPKVEYRVVLTFRDESGRLWEVDECYEAVPVLAGSEAQS